MIYTLSGPPSLALSEPATCRRALTFRDSSCGFTDGEVDLTEAELTNKRHYRLRLLSFTLLFCVLFRRSDSCQCFHFLCITVIFSCFISFPIPCFIFCLPSGWHVFVQIPYIFSPLFNCMMFILFADRKYLNRQIFKRISCSIWVQSELVWCSHTDVPLQSTYTPLYSLFYSSVSAIYPVVWPKMYTTSL